MRASSVFALRRRFAPSFLLILAVVFAAGSGGCSRIEVEQEQDDAYIAPSGDNTDGDVSLGELGDVPPETAGAAGATPSVMEPVYFPFDSSVLGPDATEALRRNSAYLKDNPRATVQVEGHCDERGSTEYNLGLGERRANAAKNYLVTLGVERERISIVSYGEERPADPGRGETAWAKNRRAEFVTTTPP
jgi:peptidoglycan-associated lipoprotein